MTTSKGILFMLLGLFVPLWMSAQNFTEIAASLNIDTPNRKNGGLAWGDFNNDGCLDLIVNTGNGNSAPGSFLYVSNCVSNPDAITFTDVTNTLALGLKSNIEAERSLVWGDFNNDGFLDFARNGSTDIEIYLNNGLNSTPNFSFGDAAQNPNYTLSRMEVGNLNAEGMAWADINGDGWLDLVFDNHGNGTEVLMKQNMVNPCVEGFDFSEGSALGLIPGSTTGDYMVAGDLNNDGWADLLIRKQQGANDLYINNQDGTFTLNTNFSEVANNGRKGGASFCDFDNDGDFDIIWTDAARNVIYENLGGDPMTFNIYTEGAAGTAGQSGIQPNVNIYGCSCGDIDNDGDVDIYLAADSGEGYLYKNDLNNGNAFTFIQDNGNINQDGRARSAVLVDYDNDGDLDVSLNMDNDHNHLWRSDLITNTTPANAKNFLKVKVLINDPNFPSAFTQGRDAIGAIATLRRLATGEIIGTREVNGGTGHGSQEPLTLHFGLPDGPDATYELTVHYPHMNGTRLQQVLTVVPSSLANQTQIVSVEAVSLNIGICDGATLITLPIELRSFGAKLVEENHILLNWETSSEQNNRLFILERSADAENFQEIARLDGAGNSTIRQSYSYLDQNPIPGLNYYRLRWIDFEGKSEFSSVIAIARSEDAISILPNPTSDKVYINTQHRMSDLKVEVLNNWGDIVKTQRLQKEKDAFILHVTDLSPGLYFLKVNTFPKPSIHTIIIQ